MEGAFLCHGGSAEAVVDPLDDETSQVEASLVPSQVAVLFAEHHFLSTAELQFTTSTQWLEGWVLSHVFLVVSVLRNLALLEVDERVHGRLRVGVLAVPQVEQCDIARVSVAVAAQCCQDRLEVVCSDLAWHCACAVALAKKSLKANKKNTSLKMSYLREEEMC